MSLLRSMVWCALVMVSSLALVACAQSPPIERPVTYTPPLPPSRPVPGRAAFVDFALLFGRSLASNSVRVSGWNPAWLSRVMLSPNVHVPGAREAGPVPGVAFDENPSGSAVASPLAGALLRQLVAHGTSVFPPANLRAWRGDLPRTDQPPITWAERALIASRDGERPTALLIVDALAVARTRVDVVLLPDDTGFHAGIRGSEAEGVCAPMSWSIPTLALLAEIVTTADGRMVARIDERRSSTLLSRGLVDVEGGARARDLVRRNHTAIDEPIIQSFCEAVEARFQAFVQENARFDHAPDVLRGFLAPALDPLYAPTTVAAAPRAVATEAPEDSTPEPRRRRRTP